MKLTFHGHATWSVDDGKHRVLIDPFLSGNPQADRGPDAFDALDAIVVTHGHDDHMADVETIAKRTGALVVSNFEISGHFESKGCKVHPMHVGGKWQFDFGAVKFTHAEHGSGSLGIAMGAIVMMERKKVYHAGDTGLFSDMQLIGGLWGPLDAALLPIGDNFTMGVDDAVKATEFLNAAVHIPMHYGTFPLVDADPQEFVERVRAAGRNAAVVAPGESYEI